jgi:hypothetical protein
MINFKQDNGEFFFQTAHMSLICPECLKLDTAAEMILCRHEEYKLPQWKSGPKQARLTQLTLKFDNAGRGLRENFGLPESSQETSFDKKHIKAIFDDDGKRVGQNYRGTPDPTFIMMAIDPNAGGESETAIISGFFLNETPNKTIFTTVIVGMDAKKCRDHNEQQLIITRHIGALREEFPTTTIIVVPENQTGFFHTMVGEYVFGFPDVKILTQNGVGKVGVRKTDIITAGYVQTMTDALRESSIKFYHKWFTCTTHSAQNFTSGGGASSSSSSGGGNAVASQNYFDNTKIIKEKLRDELIRFGYNKEKKKLTGKMNGYTDDKAIAMMMLLYWGKAVLNAHEDNPYFNLLPEKAINAFLLGQFFRKRNFNAASRIY